MFDTFSRPIAVQNPLGNVGSTIYDNYDRVWYQVDALGNCVTNGFDGFSRFVAQIDETGTISTTIWTSMALFRQPERPGQPQHHHL